MKEKKIFLVLLAVFLAAYFIPFSKLGVQNALVEAFLMVQEYARLHVLFCLVPAFFIAGAISVFVRKESVIKYLRPRANKFLSYDVASGFAALLVLASQAIFPKHDDAIRNGSEFEEGGDGEGERPLWKTALYVGTMIGILVFMNWAQGDPSVKAWYFVYRIKWVLTAGLAVALAWMLVKSLTRDGLKDRT